MEQRRGNGIEYRISGIHDNSCNKASISGNRTETGMRLREIHHVFHIVVQGFKLSLECFKTTVCRTLLRLSRRIGKFQTTLRVVMVLRASTNNISI